MSVKMVGKRNQEVPRKSKGRFNNDVFPEMQGVKTLSDCVVQLIQNDLTNDEIKKIDEVISLLINKKTEQLLNNIYESKY